MLVFLCNLLGRGRQKVFRPLSAKNCHGPRRNKYGQRLSSQKGLILYFLPVPTLKTLLEKVISHILRRRSALKTGSSNSIHSCGSCWNFVGSRKKFGFGTFVFVFALVNVNDSDSRHIGAVIVSCKMRVDCSLTKH